MHSSRGLQERAELEVLQHGHVGKQLAALRDLDHAAAHDVRGVEAGECHTLEGDAPGTRHQPGDRVEQAGLARAVRADEADDLAVAHLERHAAHGLHAAVGDAYVLNRQHPPGAPR